MSISYKEALNLFVNESVLSIITNISTYIFGQNDLALRGPFVIFYVLSSFLMYKITKNYFKYEKDRFINIVIFMTLPGVLSASLLVNTAIIVIFFTLIYIYYYQTYQKHLYVILPFLLLVDNSFAILFLSLFFFSFKTKDRLLLYLSVTLFFLSLYIYGFSTDGKPKGFLIDTVGIYSAIFSPVLFLYFLYAIYKVAFSKDTNLVWYISFTALILSIIISFRQRVYIEDFAPFVVIFLPMMLKMFLNAYRVRLKEFRKAYNILAILIIFMLFINVFLTFINKPLYYVLPEPKKHFVYQYHFAKDLSKELKAKNINNIIVDDNELALRLKFYQIEVGDRYFLSTKEFYNYDEKIAINYLGKDIFFVYIKKL
ncbi:glycosyltransferase family 39 protein [Aliarcobacter cibarius]|uniref:glycosyltransferase family 39 protein n=1 Tax=Aliarcobacter cibarius TaxID=255507 RepID=UPI0004B56CDB|nr:glycosyltransferase family 39 protein [Aliarcobacter cibarius]